MTRQNKHALAFASILGVFATSPAHAASVTKVNSWGASGVPSYLTMYIYVPDKVATNPPILVGCHSCGTPVDGYKNSIKKILAAADANGFIVILPEATGRNCWDVGTTKSLTHDGGGDTQGVAQMVKYALDQYQGDASRVYIMGGSSGAMMTQAMIAVVPRGVQGRFGPGRCSSGLLGGRLRWRPAVEQQLCRRADQQDRDGVGRSRARHEPGLHRAAPADPALPRHFGSDHQLQQHEGGHQRVDERARPARDAHVDRYEQDLDRRLRSPVLEERVRQHRARGLVREGWRPFDELRGRVDPRVLRARQGRRDRP